MKEINIDLHRQIGKYIGQEEKGIMQQFDVCHFYKNIRKKIGASAKKTPCVGLAA